MERKGFDRLTVLKAENGWIVREGDYESGRLVQLWVAPTATELGALVRALVTTGEAP